MASPSLMAGPAIGFGRPGRGVAPRLGMTDVFPVLSFLRAASLSLDSDMFGEPGRFSLPFFMTSTVRCFPDGVVLPLVFAPDAPCSFWLAFLPSSSSLS